MSNSELDTSTITKTEIAIGVIFLLVMAVITSVADWLPEFPPALIISGMKQTNQG